MEPSKNLNFVQSNPSVRGNEYLGHESQVYKVDTTGHASSSLKFPETLFSDPKPVHNFSIQTGEVFALEFMRDRVNPRKPFIPNISGDTSYVAGYLEQLGIVGNLYTGTESGSDISMIAREEKGSREFGPSDLSLLGNKGNLGYSPSSQSVRHVSSGYHSGHRLVYTSSGASDSSSSKVKILCSFGGGILPRPSDGKLRYVGGETRIIRIRKDITWQELWQKATAIYYETQTIKYQLPGEDLDALVSVSTDEDLLNMMEECHVLEDGDGSKKLRMFLFSLRDLDDAHFSLSSSDCDTEIKYVVAVNGMDSGSKKGSVIHGLSSFSGNNLNELEALNVEKDTSGTATEFIDANTINSTGFLIPSTAESSKPLLSSSCKGYETDLHHNHEQTRHRFEDKQHLPQFGYNLHPANYEISESSAQPSSYGTLSKQKGLEGKPLSIPGTQVTDVQEIESKLRVDSSIQMENGSNRISAKEQFITSQARGGNSKSGYPVEESSAVIPKLGRELSSKTSKVETMAQEPLPVSITLDTVNPPELPKSSGNEYQIFDSLPASESVNTESDPTDLSYFESSIPPQRTFYSECIPREQAELLSRISKSDDSHSSQFIVNQPRIDMADKDLVTGFENSQNGNVGDPTRPPIAIDKPKLIAPEALDDWCTKPHGVRLDDQIEDQGSVCDQDLKSEAEAGLNLPAVSHEDSIKNSEGRTTDCVDEVGSQSIANDDHGHPQLSTLAGAMEESSVDVPRTEQGDIIIDINDRFPRDFLSDIFSKAILSGNSSHIAPLPKDRAGLSINIENHEPKHWSFFQRLAGDQFARRDVSLIDQDHVFSANLTKLEEEAPLAYDFVQLARDGIAPSHRELQDNSGVEDPQGFPHGDEAVSMVLHSNYNASQVNVSEGMQDDDLMDNMRIQDSDYEEGIGNIGLPLFDPSLVDFDIHSLQIIKNADLEELRELGSGTFGTVYHGKWRGSDVAIKRIKKSCFIGRQSEQERLTFEFWREAEILSKLHHPNVVAFYGVVQDGPGATLATVTEYMVDGSLRHVLLRKDRHLDRRKRLIIAMDAAFGMEYLHSKNIVHFDLKCDNLLVNLKDPSRPICKVGDFGLSKIKRNTLVSGGVRGTLPWMAPELLNGGSNKVSEKVDVFSFGIVLWEILTGEEPYANMHYGAIIGGIVSNTLRPPIPSYCDLEWKRLMEQCWAPNPSMRPSFTEIASRLRIMSASAQSRKVSS
ncbi:RAF-like serine/threonine-protein kinase 20 [Primulina tabacum]|uniref:RAF-like serine/threonine-protein kinase 20 n=1 Tax=Primulina tabacum TaxID=48773 RepID=UPI003F59DC6C